MKLRLTERAARQVRGLPTPIKRRLKVAMMALVADPFGRKGTVQVRKLRSSQVDEAVHRLKMGGWRIGYLVRGDLILVIHVFPRDEGYAWMERFGFLD